MRIGSERLEYADYRGSLIITAIPYYGFSMHSAVSMALLETYLQPFGY